MERDNRTRTLRVRIRPSEEQMFKRMANINDMSVSDYVRRVLKYQVKLDVNNIRDKKKVS
jgi:uncharacterized protein (DUF1778 family)